MTRAMSPPTSLSAKRTGKTGASETRWEHFNGRWSSIRTMPKRCSSSAEDAKAERSAPALGPETTERIRTELEGIGEGDAFADDVRMTVMPCGMTPSYFFSTMTRP